MKKSTLLLTLFALMFTISGCSQIDTVKTDDSSQDNVEATLPERPADIVGLVKSITGNEIRIMKIESTPAEESTPKDEETAPTITGTGGGGGMGGGGGTGSGGTGDPSDRIAMMKERSIGEVTVIVSVGIPVFNSTKNTDTSAEQKRIIEEATFSDIAVEKMLNIWLNPDTGERQVAEYVSIFNF